MKDLHEGRLYWQETLPSPKTYPALAETVHADVAIVGGGMSGAITGYYLARHGLRTIILERDRVAGGSSLANTGLLQFCNDIMLTDLIDQIGERDAVAFYKACADAIQELEAITASLPADTGFMRNSSLYVASSEQDVPKLKQEYDALRTNGFDVEYWEPERIQAHFPFKRPGAIVTHGDAEVNPYQFVHAVVEEGANRFGLMVHEQSDITDHLGDEAGGHILKTATGADVHAKHVIYAIGYEPEELRGQLIKSEMNRTSVIVTAPQPDVSPWHRRFLIWETARPYFYTRLTADDRVIAGGYDEIGGQPLTSRDARDKIAHKLAGRVHELFPSFQAEPAYEWNATFAVSRDNLPFIGEDPKWPHVYYCLGYGGNGTVYSMVGASLLRDIIQGRSNPIAPIIGLGRPSLQNA